ncbi:MAG: hypothetical protein R3C11_29475 [Planctomycetaceae bacterium]
MQTSFVPVFFVENSSCVDAAISTVVETLAHYGFEFSRTPEAFDVGGLLGAGGTSFVVEAIQREDGRPVTLKILNPRSAIGKYQAVASFAIEIIVGSYVSTKSMISHASYGRHGDEIFIVRESADKITPEFTDNLSPTELGLHFSQYCDSILNLHNEGFAAVDVVPSNFLRCTRGVVFGDIGSARRTRHDAVGSDAINEVISRISSAGNCELHHAAIVPECAMSQDIAGLGLIFYETLTGQKVPGAENFPYVSDKCLRIARPSFVNPRAPAVFDEIVQQMLRQLTSPVPSKLADFARQLRSI